MIIEGGRIIELVKRAKSEVILCAPFIKAKVFEIILENIPETIPVRIVTRWRPNEVAAGISDLQIFDIASERAQTELSLLHHLHAKLYVADDNCLVGSANLTATALGWLPESNLEILLPVPRSEPDVHHLIEMLKLATPATFQIRDEIEKKAKKISMVELDEGREISSGEFVLHWLPRCAKPSMLFEIYQNPETTNVIEPTRDDAIADLSDLLILPGMSYEDFKAHIRTTLYKIPSFKRILDSISNRLTDADGVQMITELRPNMPRDDLEKQWTIIRDWISLFFDDRFEVASDQFVLRLKSK